MRWLPRILWILLTACTDLPWGAGGPELTPVSQAALTRVLGPEELTLGGRRLTSELTTRLGHALPLRDLTLPIGPGYEVALDPLSAALGPLTLAVSQDAGLHLTLELSVPSQPLIGLPVPCDAQVSQAAGALLLDFDLSVDKLGRPLPIPRGPARWQGPPPELSISGCGLSDLQVPDLGPRLVKSAWTSLQEPLIQLLPTALGLDLALSTSSVVGLDALGAGVLRASLRLSPTSATVVEAGLAVTFELGLDAEAHPCADLALPAAPVLEPSTSELPEQAGTALAISAAERLLRFAWVAGSVCGASAWSNIPDELRELPLTDLALPGGAELTNLDPSATVSASFWPRELPILTADDTMPDSLRIDVPRIEADVTVVLEGARWRLFTLELDLTVRGQLAADAEGFVHFDPIDVEATVRASARGLIDPPSLGASPVIEPIVRALLESRPILRLPPSLTPNRTTVWRVTPAHLTLPSAW